MRRRQVFRFVAVAAALTIVPAIHARAAERQDERTTPIGVAKIDITPEVPVRMYGYASRKTESEGIAGRLNAKALVIGGDPDAGPAVLLTVDCGAVPADIRDEVLRRIQSKQPLRKERFMLCNSHNHSGPNLKGMSGMEGSEYEHLASYAEQLTDKLESVVAAAFDAQRPCQLEWTSGTVGIAANRRVLKDGKWSGFGAVPDAPVDHSLPVMRVTDADGKLVAVIVNYACHCTTLRGDFKQIHGDWAACAQAYIEAEHPGTVALTTIGCGADSDPCPHSTVDLCEKHGRAMADEVARLLKGEFQPVAPKIVARQKFLKVPFLAPPSMEELKDRVGRSWALERLLERLQKGEKLEPKSFQVSTWTFGDDLAMVFFSDEVVVDYVLRLKRELNGERLWVTAYSNDINCYIASERVLDEGGYEARNSLSNLISYGEPNRVQPSIEERIIKRVKELLPDTFLTKSSQ